MPNESTRLRDHQRYHGRLGENVEAWLFQLEESNRLFPVADEQQHIYVALSLREDSRQVVLSDADDRPSPEADWESFITKLRQQLVHLDQK